MVLDIAASAPRSSAAVMGLLPRFPGFIYELRGYWGDRPAFAYMSSTHYITGHDVSHWSSDFDAVSEFVHPDDVAIYEQLRARARVGDPEVSAEYRERTVDGQYIWVREVARRGLDDAGSDVLTGFCVDISATRDLEAGMLERERRVRALLGAASAQLVEFDERGRLVYASDNALSGLPDAAFASPESWLSIAADDDRERVRQVVLDAFQRRTGCDLAFRVAHEDGSLRSIRFVLTYFASELGKPGWIGVLSDISTQSALAQLARVTELQARAVTERAGAILYRWRRGVATFASIDGPTARKLSVHRADLGRFDSLHHDLVATRGPLAIDFRWRPDDAADWRWVRATVCSVGDGMTALGAFLPSDDALWREREAARVGAALTVRERQVFERLSAGLTNRELAHELSLTEKTVSHHVANVLQKLRLRNRAGAAAFAARIFRS
jgi:PAS domain S-box-containing protein